MLRHSAIRSVIDSKPKAVALKEPAKFPWENIWGSNVFSDDEIKKRVPSSVFNAYRTAVQSHTPLSTETADVIASAMKDTYFRAFQKTFCFLDSFVASRKFPAMNCGFLCLLDKLMA
jgi:glutamine synthetase type III